MQEGNSRRPGRGLIRTINPSHNGQESSGKLVNLCYRRGSMRSVWERTFIARTKALRNARCMSQQQMADALGIPLARYKKYESRTPMPHHLIVAFCAIVDCDFPFYFTGRGRGPKLTQSPLKDG